MSLRTDLAGALARLTPELRAVIEPTCLNGRLHTEIAETLECLVGPVRTPMMTARRRLRLMPADDDDNASEAAQDLLRSGGALGPPLCGLGDHRLACDGALSPAEAAAVERHRTTCPDCAAEIERQQGVAAELRQLEDFEAPRARSWESLRARHNALRAHRVATGAVVQVGVVDSGIDADPPDLAGRVAETRDFVGLGAAKPAEAHGAAVAAILAADAGNGGGIVGMAPGAELIGLRACWQMPGGVGRGSSFSLAR